MFIYSISGRRDMCIVTADFFVRLTTPVNASSTCVTVRPNPSLDSRETNTKEFLLLEHMRCAIIIKILKINKNDGYFSVSVHFELNQPSRF